MDNKELEFVSVIVTLLLKYGLPAVIEAIQTMQVVDPTLEDIRALKCRVKHPDEYLGNG